MAVLLQLTRRAWHAVLAPLRWLFGRVDEPDEPDWDQPPKSW